MFTDLKPYPEFLSQSGTIGQTPTGWASFRLKSLVRNVVDFASDRHVNDTYLALEHVESWTGRIHLDPSASFDSQVKRFESGDVLFGKLRPYLAKVVVPSFGGVCAGEFFVIRPKSSELSCSYLGFLMRSAPVITLINGSTFGAQMPRADWGFVGSMRIAVPPKDEQAAIVKYLGHANARIDRAIAAKRKLIALLEEQQQAVINHAVTRGLDPDVPMKDSGIPWLGSIPVHWNVRRAKYLLRDIDARSETGLEEQLSVSHLTGVTPRRLKNVTMFMAASYVGHKTCRAGDLVVNTMWAWMGALGCAREAGLVSPAYNVYRPLQGSGADTEFVGALFRTATYIAYFRSNSTGVRASRLRFYPDELLATPVVLPPSDEQAAIVLAIEELRARVSADLEKVAREIELLREFRTRLTADVVTGQLDIRDAAARLPDLDPADLVSNIGPDEDDLDADLEAGLELTDVKRERIDRRESQDGQ